MKKGKLLSAFTSLALAGTMLASALPFTASAASVQTDLQLSMSADKTSFSLDEIKAGAKATVYVNADGEFQTANITSLGAKFKSSDWRVRAKNVEISYRNQIANNKGDRFSSFYSIATFGEWTKDFPVDQDMYEEYEGEIEDPISYAVKAKTEISDTNMPAIQIISNKNIGYFKKGTGSSVAHFDVEFPTDLEAGTYTIDFADVQLPVGIDDYGHLGDGIAKSATGITFTVGDSQPTTEPVTTAATKATTAATSASGIQLSRDYTGTVKLSAEKVSAAAGDKKVALNIYADTNGFTIENLTFKVQYDSKLTLNTEESFKKGLGIRPGTTTFEASTNTYLFIISGDTPAKNYTDKPIGTLYFDVAADAEGELPVQLVPGQGLAKIECLQHSESKNGLKKFYLDPEVTDGAVVIGSSSSDDLTVEVDDSALDTKGDNINWYFADEAEFDKSNITVMSGDKDVTADADIKFDSTPEKKYNGKTFDYTVSYTATYGGKNATGTVDVKIGLRGDADCSHKVDARDAAAIAKDLAQLYGSKKTTLTKKNGEFALFLANVDEGVAKKETTWYGKRDINARDAAKIAEYLSKKFKNPNLELVDLVKK